MLLRPSSRLGLDCFALVPCTNGQYFDEPVMHSDATVARGASNPLSRLDAHSIR